MEQESSTIKRIIRDLLPKYEAITYQNILNLKNLLKLKSSFIVSITNELDYVYKLYDTDLSSNFDYSIIQERVVLEHIRSKVILIDRDICLNRMHNNCEDYIVELNQLQQDKKRLNDSDIIKKHVPIEMIILLSYTLNPVTIKKTLLHMAVSNLNYYRNY